MSITGIVSAGNTPLPLWNGRSGNKLMPKTGRQSTSHTPAFVLNGREWRSATVPVVNDEAPGVLKVTVQDSNAVMISFEPTNGSSEKFDVYLARLGFGVAVNVRAGENNGRSLRHDFVVLSLVHEKMGSGTQELRFPGASESAGRPERSALAAWVTKEGDINPLQAVGGWLPGAAMTGIRLAVGRLVIASRWSTQSRAARKARGRRRRREEQGRRDSARGTTR